MSRDWYQKLKEHSGTTEEITYNSIRDEYKKAVSILHKPPKDFHAWLSNWEQVMTRAIPHEVSEVTKAKSWFEDFLQAVEPQYSHWAAAYRITREADLKADTLSYRTVANDFRRGLAAGKNLKGKVSKGSFGPSFGAESDGAEGDAPRSAGSAKAKTSSSSHSHKRAASEKQDSCPVCYQPHQLAKCYYAFPEKAPDGFLPRSHVQQRAKENLQKPDVADLVQKLKLSAKRSKRQRTKTGTPAKPESTDQDDPQD